MKQLKQIIHKILSDTSVVDWLIIHSISESTPKIAGVEFSFVDGKERYNEPFKTNQGYISLNNAHTIEKFDKIINELTIEFKASPIALANIFIITTRASYKSDSDGKLLKALKKNFGTENSKKVFNLLINSLNGAYHKEKYSSEKQPDNTEEWLALFRSSQYMHSISDPIISCLQLVKNERNRKLNFDLIQNMAPILRAVLIGWYSFKLSINSKTLSRLYKNEQELIFLSACLIDDFSAAPPSPIWLTKKLVEQFVEKHWTKIGKAVFNHVFGLSFRNKQKNELYKKMEEFLHEILLKKLSIENSKTHTWIGTFEFPNDFIALFSWFSSKDIDYTKIPISNKSEILNQFIRELKRIEKELPHYLAAKSSSDPFNSFQFYEEKYQNSFAHFLFLIRNSTDNNFKDLKELFFSFKLLFYGGFKATLVAKHFTEIMILIGLSAYRINGLGEKEVGSIKEFMNIISDIILVPYIHLSEREDEVWNPDSKKELLQYNAGQYLINESIAKIKEHEIKKFYCEFFNELKNIKVSS